MPVIDLACPPELNWKRSCGELVIVFDLYTRSRDLVAPISRAAGLLVILVLM